MDTPSSTRPLLVTLPMSDEDVRAWMTRRDQAIAQVERKTQEWRVNTQQYEGKVFVLDSESDRVVVPKDYAKVERKKAALLFALPQVTLKPLQAQLAGAVPVFQARLNAELGPMGVDALDAVNGAAFDALCTSGFGVVKVGYEPIADGVESVQVGTQSVPGPASPGSVLGLSAPMVEQPVFAEQPKILYERYFMEHLSPAKFLWPSDFRGGNFDKAPWLGALFLMPKTTVASLLGLDEDDLTEADQDPHLITPPETGDERPDRAVRVTEFSYYASRFDASAKHPLKLRQLVFVEGITAPVVHRDLPWQVWDANGRFRSGVIGHPFKVLKLRDVTDAATPKSDVHMTRPQVMELSRGRTQMLNQRDRNVPLRLADVERLGGKETVEKINAGTWQALIPVPSLDPNNPPVHELARSSFPPEDFTFNTIIDRDINEAWGMGANQGGLETAEGKSATEQALVQRNADARLDKERQKVLAWFALCAGYLGALIQLFDDRTEMVEVLGPEGEAQLQPWDRQAIQGRYVYEVHPDAGQRIDGEKYLKDLMDSFNYLARDPRVNRAELIRPIVSALKLDPSRVLVPQLPAKGPDPANVSFRFSGDDLDVTNPKWPIVEALLKQSGYQIPDDAVTDAREHAALQSQILQAAGVASAPGAAGPTARPGRPVPGLVERDHPGAAPQAEKLSSHQAAITGKLPNAPSPADRLGLEG